MLAASATFTAPVQDPATHAAPTPTQVVPQPPQFVRLVEVFASQPFDGRPSQSWKLVWQDQPHTPLPEHVGFAFAGAGHVTVAAHWPLLSQVWVPLPAHLTAPGVQTPVQEPAEQTKGQELPFVQWPVVSHVCGVSPEHCFAPGTQIPEHAPEEQTKGHA